MERRRRPRLSLDLLKGFEAAARHLSFTRAAKELFVTQSAVSREIKTLEEQLGGPLFRRVHRGLKLTESGRVLYQAVGDALKLIDKATEELGESATPRAVTVTTTVSVAALWLVPRLSQFTAMHPNIDVRIAASNRVLDLRNERIDLAIRHYMPGSAPVAAGILMKEQVFPACAPSLLRDPARPLRRPEDLARHVWLRFEATRAGRPWHDWPLWLEASGLTALKPASSLSFSHYEQLVQAALAGQGIALGRSPMLSGLFDSSLLVAPFPGMSVDYGALYSIVAPQSAEREPVALFLDWLRNEARALLRKGGPDG